MNNKNLGDIFYSIAELLEIAGENKFKVRAYYKGAEIIATYPHDLENIYKENGLKGLTAIPGIGQGLAEKIEEHVKTGAIAYLKEIEKKLPEGLLDILKVNGVGPKKAKLFYEKLGIKSLEALEKAASSGKIRDLDGMGQKSEEKILKSLEFLKKSGGRRLLGEALPIAEAIVERLQKIKGVKQVAFAGSVRRGKETVRDIDILVTSSSVEPVMKAFTEMSEVKEILANGDTKASVLTEAGLQVDLRVLPDKDFGAALNYFTGSKDHNVVLRQLAIKKGLKLSEYGVFKGNEVIASKTEADIYKALGLAYIPPEIRENRGEIELAAKGATALPVLVTEKDIKGDLHMHTTASDGTDSLTNMVAAAKERGYEYIGLTDHSMSLKVARGLSIPLLRKNIELVREANKNIKGIKVLAGSEIDILSDGTLDYPLDVIDELDYCIVSIHTAFGLKKDEMTKRVIKAFKTGKVNIFGHPTGRILNERDAYEIDMEEVIKAAADYNVVLELNSYPGRLDTTDIYCRLAKEKGVKICINTDAHAVGEFSWMKYGVITARRGWLTKKDVLNCFSLRELIEWLKAG